MWRKRDSKIWTWLFVALFEHTGIVTHIMRLRYIEYNHLYTQTHIYSVVTTTKHSLIQEL